MAMPFKFLFVSEFNRLSLEDKRAYLMNATEELERTELHHVGGWNILFRQEQQPQSPSVH